MYHGGAGLDGLLPPSRSDIRIQGSAVWAGDISAFSTGDEMLVIAGSRGSDRRATERLQNIHIAIAILGLFLCLNRVPAAERGHDRRPVLQVPVSDSTPVIDGRLDEPC